MDPSGFDLLAQGLLQTCPFAGNVQCGQRARRCDEREHPQRRLEGQSWCGGRRPDLPQQRLLATQVVAPLTVVEGLPRQRGEPRRCEPKKQAHPITTGFRDGDTCAVGLAHLPGENSVEEQGADRLQR